jgi:hypothetical protein
MMRSRASGVGAVALAVLVAGCTTGATGSTSPPPTPPTSVTPSPAPATAPRTRTAPPTSARAAVLPAELVGAWSSSGENTEIAYRFLADGRFRSIEILSQPRPGGVFEFRRQQDGTAQVSGDRLRLRPTASVTSRTDPDDPAGDYTNRPTGTADRAYTWEVSGTTLVLTDADGLTLRLERAT